MDLHLLKELLISKGQTVATAESCSGGRIAAALTSLPGSSGCYRGGIVAYHNQSKQEILHVPLETLQAHGAVSEQTVLAMAVGAAELFHSEWALACSGVAGPQGAPVGLVWMAIVQARVKSIAWKGFFPGDREAVMAQVVEEVLKKFLIILQSKSP